MDVYNCAISDLTNSRTDELVRATKNLQESLSPKDLDDPADDVRFTCASVEPSKSRISKKDVFTILGLAAAYLKAAPEMKSILMMFFNFIRKFF